MPTRSDPKHAVTVISADAGLGRLWPAECWTRRDLLLLLAAKEITLRYRHTLLGVAWVVLQPAALVLIFTLVLGRVAASPDGTPYAIVALAAMPCWTLFAKAIAEAGTSLSANERLLAKAPVPRLLLPSAGLLAGAVDAAVILALAVIITVATVGAGWHLAALPAALALTALGALGTAWAVAAFDGMFRDVRHAVPTLCQLVFFASPIAYPASLVPERWHWAYGLNPVAGAAECVRWSLIGGQPPSTALLASSIGVTVAGLIAGLLLFRAAETRMSDRL